MYYSNNGLNNAPLFLILLRVLTPYYLPLEQKSELTFRSSAAANGGRPQQQQPQPQPQPSFLRESPFDGRVKRGVKRAYSTMDGFSCRIGATLKRYPMARIFLLCYMVSIYSTYISYLLTYLPSVIGTGGGKAQAHDRPLIDTS